MKANNGVMSMKMAKSLASANGIISAKWRENNGVIINKWLSIINVSINSIMA